MSSLPGYTLEDFLAWNYDITVEDQKEANVSRGIAEALGNIPERSCLSKELFAQVVSLFECHRESVESCLVDFDEDNQSWRTYAGCAFDFIPDALYDQGKELIQRLLGFSVYEVPKRLPTTLHETTTQQEEETVTNKSYEELLDEVALLKSQLEENEKVLKTSASLSFLTCWIAFTWNDHNFKSNVKSYAVECCQKLGITDFDKANEYLAGQFPGFGLVLDKPKHDIKGKAIELGDVLDKEQVNDILLKHGIMHPGITRVTPEFYKAINEIVALTHSTLMASQE